MFSGAQVYQVARSVANGDGDWAEVPRCVREAIVLALAKGDGARSPSLDGVARSQAYFDPSSPLPPVLTEGVVQRSIRTFEDAEWMRDQAVRCFAQFHNSVETLHAAMASQMSPLMRTAMQLHPDVLATVKQDFNLTRGSTIPDGVALRDDDVARITHQEYILDEMATRLRELRDASVSFAANFLTDTEKLAMGANPAYLRPDTREAMQHRHRHARKPPPSSSPHKKTPERTPAPTTTPEKASKRVLVQKPGLEADSPSQFRNDAYLCELRERYMLRLAQLNEAEQSQVRSSSRPHSAKSATHHHHDPQRACPQHQKQQHQKQREQRKRAASPQSSASSYSQRRSRSGSASSSRASSDGSDGSYSSESEY